MFFLQISIELIYNVVLVSDVQQISYVCVHTHTHTHTYVFFSILLSIMVYYNMLNIFLCSIHSDFVVYLFYM